jgi:hypothetical protein
MNKNSNQEDYEADLTQISNRISHFIKKIKRSVFLTIQFFIKNVTILTVLILFGFGIGLYFDKSNKIYESEIIITPNFESVDYLYNKIDLIESKIISGDTLFLKNVVGISKPNIISKIEIKPISDIYKFIQTNEQNFELVKILAEEGDVKKVIDDKITSKNYTLHNIYLTTNEKINEKKSIQPLLNYLNNSEYYIKKQNITVQNVREKMIQNELIISQINEVLNGFSKSIDGSQKNNNLVYYNENTQLNDVIKTKEAVLNEQAKLRIDLLGYDKIIKASSSSLNKDKSKSFTGKLTIIIPFLFLFLYLISFWFIRFYRNQKQEYYKNNENLVD